MNYYKQADMNKSQLDRQRPLTGVQLREFKEYYRVGLTYTSNALEGNTLTESETKVILEDGLTVGGKPIRDCYEAVGHAQAYDFMFSLINKSEISVEDIQRLHFLFYNRLDADKAGKWREHNVIVTGTDFVFPNHYGIPTMMHELTQWMRENESVLHPVKYAALVHLKFVTIHPFTDGNGRCARLLMNLSLLRAGYDLAIIPPICRSEYLDTLRVAQRKNDDSLFCNFIAERVVENQKDMMRMLHIPYVKANEQQR